jgi:hypothetical protein
VSTRPLEGVVKALLNIIPTDHPNYNYLKTRAEAIIKDIQYVAPEAMPGKFTLINQLLLNNIDLSNDDWYETMVKIWTGQLNYEDYL